MYLCIIEPNCPYLDSCPGLIIIAPWTVSWKERTSIRVYTHYHGSFSTQMNEKAKTWMWTPEECVYCFSPVSGYYLHTVLLFSFYINTSTVTLTTTALSVHKRMIEQNHLWTPTRCVYSFSSVNIGLMMTYTQCISLQVVDYIIAMEQDTQVKGLSMQCKWWHTKNSTCYHNNRTLHPHYRSNYMLSYPSPLHSNWPVHSILLKHLHLEEYIQLIKH